MDAAFLLENFETIAEAPGGVKRLRELILRLAVEGRLVEHSPTDEPAKELLDRVKARREQLVAKGIAKRLRDITDTEPPPYRAPRGWCWTTVEQVTQKLGAGSTPRGGRRTYVQTGIKFLRSQNVWNDGLHLAGVARIPPATHDKMSATHLRAGDVLLNITGASIGRSALVPDDFDEGNVSQHVAIVRPVLRDLGEFLHIFLISPLVQNRITAVQVGISRAGLSMTRLRRFPFSLPPLGEQRRIVARVDELMGLCDDLEARQQHRHRVRQSLQTSALDALTTADTAEALATAWSRICKHWATLTAYPDSIVPLREAILQLAVHGKIVPQDPNDEAAVALLERTEAHRVQLVKEKRIARPKSFPSLATAQLPFSLPPGWEWCRVQDVGEVKLGRQRSPANHNGPHMVPYLRVANVMEARLDLRDVKKMNFTSKEQEVFRLRDGDILLNEGQSYELVGRPALYRGEIENACFQNTLLRFRTYADVDINYVLLVFRAFMHGGRFREESQQTTNIAHLSATRLSGIEFPLAPLPEQTRIVARTDELLALCDALEKMVTRQRRTSATVSEAAVVAA